MAKSSKRLARFTYALISVVLIFYIIINAKGFLAPLTFGILFAAMLKPLCQWFERLIRFRPVAIILTFFTALLPVFGIITLLSLEFSIVLNQLGAISASLNKGVDNLLAWISQYASVSQERDPDWLSDQLSNIINRSVSFIGEGLSLSTTLLGAIILIVLFTFFFLLYRTSFKNFYLIQFPREKREQAENILISTERLTRKYLFGQGLVMMILAVLNTTGLWLIGVDYAAFWGVLAAILAIIPYIGTTLGGTLPFLYALATAGNLWQPAAVVVFYGAVQNIEGNFITPKVVGGSVDINPFAAILALILGGTLWGIAGLILALPLTAIVKVLFEHIDYLKPVGALMDRDLFSKREVFLEKFDEARYRISSFLRGE